MRIRRKGYKIRVPGRIAVQTRALHLTSWQSARLVRLSIFWRAPPFDGAQGVPSTSRDARRARYGVANEYKIRVCSRMTG